MPYVMDPLSTNFANPTTHFIIKNSSITCLEHLSTDFQTYQNPERQLLKKSRLIIKDLFGRQITTNKLIFWHLLFGGFYVCCKIDALGLQTISQGFGH